MSPPNETGPLQLVENRFDLDKMRLKQDFAGGAVKKHITTIPIGKPGRFSYIRVHSDPAFHFKTLVLDMKQDRETYLVQEELQEELAEDLTPKIILPTLTKQGTLYLWPIRLPDEKGKLDSWNRSAMQCAKIAMHHWVRIPSNMEAGGYDVIEPRVPIPEPKWPEMDLETMISIAFKHFLIDSLDHPQVRAIRGQD